MAFDKNLLPKGAITLQEFVKKHSLQEVEGCKVSYLLPNGEPLRHEGDVVYDVEARVAGGLFGEELECDLPNSGLQVLARQTFGWTPTHGWDGDVPEDVADDSVIAILEHRAERPEHGSVGKPAEEWVGMEGFKPQWLEGARFEGHEGHLVCDPDFPHSRTMSTWNSSRNPGDSLDAWRSYVCTPWRNNTPLYLTVENEAKALANIKPERVGKTIGGWLMTRGFDPKWLEGAQFEDCKGHLVRDHNYPLAQLASGWNSDRGANSADAWNEDVYTPWTRGATLHLTPENEARALAEETLLDYRVTGGHHEGWYDLTRLIADDLPVDFEALRGTDFRLRFKNASQLWVQGRFTGSDESPDTPASTHRHWRIADDLRVVMGKAWNGQEGVRILVRDVNLLDDKGNTSRAIDARDLPDDSVVEVVNQENGETRTAHISTGKLRGNNGAILGKSFVITKVLYRHKQAGGNGEN